MNIRDVKLENQQQFNKPVLIYGAGQYASIFLTYLQIQEKIGSVKGCIISHKEKNEKVFRGLAIRCVDEIKNIQDYMIIVAVARKNTNLIYQKLEERGVEQCYQLTDESIEVMLASIATYFSSFPIQDNRVFMDCFEGLGYRCNCKYLAEEFKKNDYEVVWNLSDKAVDDIPEWIIKVKRYSFEYFREAYTAKICITNDGVETKIKKRNEQVYICTWHGAGPFKKVNIDLCRDNECLKKRIQEEYRRIDFFISASKFNTQVIRRAFGYDGEILEYGSPRMDCLFKKNDFRQKICNYYRIDPDKKILLYAPTFRKSSIGDNSCPIISFEKYDLKWKMIQDALKKRYKEPFVLIYRFHHSLYRFAESKVVYSDAINVTLYPDVQELLGAADFLITDYSSIMWDFSLQRKPVFLYQNDIDEYIRDRGFYSDIEEWPYIKARTSEELSEKILGFDNDKYVTALNQFLEKYGSFDDGHACEKVIEHISQIFSR